MLVSYPCVFYYDAESNSYTAAIHDLELFVEGTTVEEAFANAKEILVTYLDYAKKYDENNANEYSNLALDVAQDSDKSDLLARTYSVNAHNYEYLGDNDKAIDSYKNALALFTSRNESYQETAYNYEQASKVMEKLGNFAKAKKLQAKANLYYQKAQLQEGQLEAVS